jgi:hypothetical protein
LLEIRYETECILKRVHPPKPNFNLRERQALRELQDNKDICILPVDKGNNMIIPDFSDYSGKIDTLLADTTCQPISLIP